MQCERNKPLERGSFCLFYEKNYKAKDIFLFKKKSNKSGQKNWRWRFLTIFTREATPEQRPERVRCISHRRSPWPPLSCTWSRSRWSRIEFSVWSIEATVAVDRARRVQLIELAVFGRCPAKLSFLPTVTEHTWRENAPQSLQKMGVGIARISKAWPPRFDFGEEGRPSHDFSDFFQPFLPWVIRRRLFKVLHKKKMKSTVLRDGVFVSQLQNSKFWWLKGGWGGGGYSGKWPGLRHHYRARNWTFDENHFLVSS